MKRRLLGFAALALVAPVAALAQGTNGTLQGRVVDEKGAPVERAAVQVLGTSRGDYTDADGKYLIAGVRAGTYEVKFSFAGKEPTVIRNVRINSDQSTTLNATLQPKGGTVVTVTADREQKAQQVGKIQNTSGEQIERSARTANVFQSAVLQAGVSSAGQNGIAIRGGRANETSIRVDGTEISDPFSGGVGSSSLGLYPTVSTLAVDQVQVISSGFDAQYGDVLSGVVNTVTRTGRNDRYEGAFRYRMNVEALNGSSDELTVKRAGTDVDTTLPAVDYLGSENKQYEFGFGGPFPGYSDLTFYLTGKLSHSPFGGGYEVYDISPEFAASRSAIARESWGFALEPTNLAKLPHDEAMVRNLQAKFKLNVTPDISLEFGGEIGLTSVESGDWSSNYLFDHPTFYTRDASGAILDSTVNTSLLERDMQQINQNTIINRGQVTYRQFLDSKTFFDVTGSYLRQRSETGKKDESKEYGIFDVYDIYLPVDADNDGAIDRYEIPSAQLRPNPFVEPIEGFGRNDITGLYEGGEVAGASRNPYGLVDLNFPVHGNARALEIQEAVELRLKGNYETNFELAEKLQTQVKAGFDISSTTLRRHENNLPWDNVPFFDVYGYEATYFNTDTTGRLRNFFSQPYTPLEGGVYLQTRFAYESIYFTPGVRFDFLNPNTYRSPFKRLSLEQIVDDLDSIGDASMKFQVSPRIGVSYPVTENSQFRVNFAMMFKMPEYNFLYNNAYNDASRGNQLFGNPDIEPQKALIYELGYSARFADIYNIDISAFYRDIYNQTDVTFVPAVPSPYVIYSVTAYGNVRGLELTARRDLSDNLYAEINYTLQKAVGTASSPGGNYATAIAGVDPYTGEKQQLPLVEYPLNYDQTHSLSATLSVVWGDDEGPSIAGVKLLENTDVTLTANFASGLPYTRENQRGEQITEFNSLRLPSTFLVEGHIERGFRLADIFGESAGNLELSLFADVFNILNNTSAAAVRLSRTVGGARFSISGSPDTDGQGFERQMGDFIATPYYKDIDPARPETWDARQYDDFGTRRYNPYADMNLDGVVTQAERYDGYQRFIATAQSLRGTYLAPRTVAVGVKLRF